MDRRRPRTVVDSIRVLPETNLQDNERYRLCVPNNRGMYRLLMYDLFYVETHEDSVPVLRVPRDVGAAFF